MRGGLGKQQGEERVGARDGIGWANESPEDIRTLSERLRWQREVDGESRKWRPMKDYSNKEGNRLNRHQNHELSFSLCEFILFREKSWHKNKGNGKKGNSSYFADYRVCNEG
jgi:hypothetical protein